MQKTPSSHHHQQPLYVEKTPHQLEIKMDTYTQHSRPVITPLVHSPTCSSYVGRPIDGTISPLRTRENPNRLSISPIKQRISFVKGQNVAATSAVNVNNKQVGLQQQGK